MTDIAQRIFTALDCADFVIRNPRKEAVRSEYIDVDACEPQDAIVRFPDDAVTIENLNTATLCDKCPGIFYVDDDCYQIFRETPVAID